MRGYALSLVNQNHNFEGQPAMSINPEELYLNENYSFAVLVETESGTFAGELSLTPQKITLSITGDQNDQRKCNIESKNLDILTCTYLNARFILIGLRFVHYGGLLIQNHPKVISHFSLSFYVKYLIYIPNDPCVAISYNYIELHSPTLKEWIGNTNKQEFIITRYKAGDPFSNDSLFSEFTYDINNLGVMRVSYNCSIHYNSPEFFAGISFPPVLSINFAVSKSVAEIVTIYNELYDLFSFITGDELQIDKICLGYGSFNAVATLYYPRKSFPDRNANNWILFPLGNDLRFKDVSLPELPLSVFDTFFNLDVNYKGYISKYVKYRRMGNVEDRFLGYFRILERLCYIEKTYLDDEVLNELIRRAKPCLIRMFGDKKGVNAFIRNLPKWNSSKYNTAKCLLEYFKQIPPEHTVRWKLGRADIESVCKLRNDITHANDYFVPDLTKERYTKFVEVLLTLAIFSKLGVDLKHSSTIIQRLSGSLLMLSR